MTWKRGGGSGAHEVRKLLRPLAPWANGALADRRRLAIASSASQSLRVDGVSRHHARLRVEPEGVLVEDLGSRNGTFVDEGRIERAVASPGADLRFGPVRLTVVARL